ncbi:MAG: type II secretion system GspH family protein [Gammaproteobacteria bacterium]|nr:type II secretion system GspH family protein [Gammaproteobacteria bacterium]
MKRTPTLQRLRGFTLIEMIVTIVLLGIISMALAPFFTSAINGFFDTQVRARLTGEGRMALERLSRELRESDPDTISVTGGSQIDFTLLDGLNGLNQTGSVVVKTYDACRDIRIHLSGTNLVWDEGADGTTDATLATNVSSVSFGYSPGTPTRSGVVAIELVMQNEGESIRLYREAHIRNSLGSMVCTSP